MTGYDAWKTDYPAHYDFEDEPRYCELCDAEIEDENCPYCYCSECGEELPEAEDAHCTNCCECDDCYEADLAGNPKLAA